MVWDVFLWASVTALTVTAVIGLNDTRKKLGAWYAPPSTTAPTVAPDGKGR